jgi:hypothetical protein
MGSASYACRKADAGILSLPKKDRIFGSRKKALPPDNTERKQSASKFVMELIRSIDLGCESPASTDELAQREIGQQSGAGHSWCPGCSSFFRFECHSRT